MQSQETSRQERITQTARLILPGLCSAPTTARVKNTLHQALIGGAFELAEAFEKEAERRIKMTAPAIPN